MHLSIWQEIGWRKITETRISCQWSFHRCRGLCYNIGYQLGIHIGELQAEDFLDANMSIMAQSCLLSFTLVYLFCLILRRVVTSPRLLFLFSGTCLTPRASLTPQLENISTCCIPVICLRYLWVASETPSKKQVREIAVTNPQGRKTVSIFQVS